MYGKKGRSSSRGRILHMNKQQQTIITSLFLLAIIVIGSILSIRAYLSVPNNTAVVEAGKTNNELAVGTSTKNYIINESDSGRTVTMNVGDEFLINLNKNVGWNISFTDKSFVKKILTTSALKAGQGMYRIAKTGAFDLIFERSAYCEPNSLCKPTDAPRKVHIIAK